jgi:hypothetical protein
VEPFFLLVKKEIVLLKKSCADCFRHMRFGGCSPFSVGSQQQDFAFFADRWQRPTWHSGHDSRRISPAASPIKLVFQNLFGDWVTLAAEDWGVGVRLAMRLGLAL